MNGSSTIVLLQVTCQHVAHLFGGAEYDGLGIGILRAQDLVKAAAFFHGADDLHMLGDGLVGSEAVGVANADLDRVAEKVGGNIPDLSGPGGGEHEGLAAGWEVGSDLAYLGLEAHVKHAIGLV
jgi:hypothetical protein